MIPSTSEIDLELNKPVTYPVYLIETDYGPQRYNSTGPTLTTMGQDWITNGAGMSGMRNAQTINITFNNADKALSMSAQLGEWRGLGVDVWYAIIKPATYIPYAMFDPGMFEDDMFDADTTEPAEVLHTFKLFSGEFDSCANPFEANLTLEAKREGIDTNLSPRQHMTAPKFNHLPAPGTVVQLGNETLVIK